MLKSYEATYENGQIKWLSDQLQISSANRQGQNIGGYCQSNRR
jgi:hypothetical protein